LRWLAMRELSSAKVRERLITRGFNAATADDALRRLQSAGALDDERAARACARTLALVKRRGRLRVSRELERMGFGPETIRDAVASVIDDHNERHLAEQALATKLRGIRRPPDQALRRRLFASLLRQGFAPSLVFDVLRHHQVDPDDPAAED
jgi:SOS response regulatory protein OraA/RecX